MGLISVVNRHRLLAGVLAIVISGSSFWAWSAYASGRGPSAGGVGTAPGSSVNPTETSSPAGASTPAVNILFMGVDKRSADVGRSDAMILMSLNPNTRDVRLLDIPRDTRVEIPGHGTDKINAAYAYGGPALAKASVSQLLGVPVDYYVEIDLAGAAKLIDTLGGVDLTIDRPMDYDDTAQNLHIHLSPGPQHLDGEQALGFVRWRSDGLGDIGRISRQQQFIKAIAAQVMTPAVLPKIPSLLIEARKSVKTDVPLGLQVSLAMAGYRAYQNGLVTATLPGTPKYIDGISYWVPDQQAIADLRAEWSRTASTAGAGKPTGATATAGA